MTLTQRDRVLLAVLAVSAVIFATWWFVVRPAHADAAAERESLALVQREIGDIRDTIDRLEADPVSESERTAERLRLAEALPGRRDTPGTVLQLQQLADQANVELTSVRTNVVEDYGALRGTEYELRVTGRFFEADDFLYRLHNQVAVGDGSRPRVRGRLFSTVSLDINLAEDAAAGSLGGNLDDTDPVTVTARVRAYSAGTAAGAGAGSPAQAEAGGVPPPAGAVPAPVVGGP